MMFRKLTSDAGIGLVQAVASAFIVALAVMGLLAASYVTRRKAEGVYHYRVALLKGLQKFEEIKLRNRNNLVTEPVKLDGITTGEFVMDEFDDVVIKGKIHPLIVTHHSDPLISQYTKYHKILMKITWRDGPQYYKTDLLNKERQLILREDYFYRASDVGQP